MSISRRDILIGAGAGALGVAVGELEFTKMVSYSDAPLNVFDYRELAKKRLPKIVFDYLEGGAGGERSLHTNREVFDRLGFRPKRLINISKRNLSITLFGKSFAAPFLIAPTGLNGSFWPHGDIALARAAEKARIPFSLSTASTSTIEAVAEGAGGEKWFQLYIFSKPLARELVGRAKAAGYTTLVLTTDFGVEGLRERDRRNGFTAPPVISPGLLFDGATHPSWALDLALHGIPKPANFAGVNSSRPPEQKADDQDPAHAVQKLRQGLDATFNWEDLKWLRSIWPHKLLVKGVLRADDAARCVAEGADGVILSNHGGRQLGDAISPLQVLAETRARIKEPIIIDSGFRRGADIVKALALGANAVQLGRATLYGLAARGETGVTEVLSMLAAEVDNTIGQIGCTSIADLTPDCIVEHAHPLAAGRVN